ncbi:hypothetical protein FA95DRAFT_1555494 [Auriscalpium vulgare]|uniref:Uncharacterized protein n=1 Tax=Auriscalpium vulgare TaxID=40419 RepID=A0ACB8S3C0_9AGAM|nr:hypothetical protein FA95DRAFT_1555494 [Auriscalpium vulgare]
MSPATQSKPVAVWWSNAVFFLAAHVAAACGLYLRPPSTVPRATLIMTILLWQIASFGITIGYHRLYSHRAFRASFGVRLVLSFLGAMAFQGSIKWWTLRHRLHHRFTDDEEHDPYCATRGLLYSHVGWIFYKPKYEKLEFIERDDLEADPVVQFQHRYYVLLALFFGFVIPTLLGWTWGDANGAFIYGGFVSRLLIWHCTFLVNSLAHWDGLQPYTDENTSRTNLVLALLTAGEGNHNFHAFPHDYRSGPAILDWDPSKWVIALLNTLGWAWGLRRADTNDIKDAIQHMSGKHADHHGPYTGSAQGIAEWAGAIWQRRDQLDDYLRSNSCACVVLIDGYAVDATSYMKEHPGGARLLRSYAVPNGALDGSEKWKDAGWAYNGGMNKHSNAARKRMAQLRVAKIAFEL